MSPKLKEKTKQIIKQAFKVTEDGDLVARQRPEREHAASRLRPEPVKWLLQNILPVGDSVILAGRKGVRKSQAAYHLVSCVVMGKEFAEEVVPTQKGRVLLFSSERSIRKVVLPRLLAAGIDKEGLKRVQIVPWADCNSLPLVEARLQKEVELDRTQGVILDDRLRMAVVDVTASYCKIEQTNVREKAQALHEFCERNDITLVLVFHVRHKGVSGKNAFEQIAGSEGWTQIASTTLILHQIRPTPAMLASLPPEPWFRGVEEVGIFQVWKSNLGRDGDRWWFKGGLTSVSGLEGANVPHLILGDVADLSVVDLLRMEEGGDAPPNKSPRRLAVAWLKGAIEKVGPPPADVIAKATTENVIVLWASPSADLPMLAKAEGHKQRTLERARRDMEEMGDLYHWQVGGKSWVALPNKAAMMEAAKAAEEEGTAAEDEGDVAKWRNGEVAQPDTPEPSARIRKVMPTKKTKTAKTTKST